MQIENSVDDVNLPTTRISNNIVDLHVQIYLLCIAFPSTCLSACKNQSASIAPLPLIKTQHFTYVLMLQQVTCLITLTHHIRLPNSSPVAIVVKPTHGRRQA